MAPEPPPTAALFIASMAGNHCSANKPCLIKSYFFKHTKINKILIDNVLTCQMIYFPSLLMD